MTRLLTTCFVFAVVLCAAIADEGIEDLAGESGVCSLIQTRIGVDGAQEESRGQSTGSMHHEVERYGHGLHNQGLFILFAFAFIAFAVLAVDYMIQTSKSDKPRDGRWDFVKFCCMTMVVFSHLDAYWWPQKPGPRLDLLGREMWDTSYQYGCSYLHMTGFSFASGLFAASFQLLQTNGEIIELNRARLRNSARDLILFNFTWGLAMIGFDFLFSGLNPTTLQRRPFVEPQYWYLNALFLWQLVTPFLCIMRWPILTAGAISALCRNFESGTAFYFVFFTAGFVIGGGGTPAEERRSSREAFEEFITKMPVRVAASVCMLLFLASAQLHDLPECVMHLTINRDFARDPLPWSMGGLVTDVARVSVAFLYMLSFIVLCFAAPACDILSKVGSRTLYVYVLQGLLFLPNVPLGALVSNSLPISSGYRHPLTVLLLAFTVTLFLGSGVMETLTRCIVQPGWLIDILLPQKQPVRSPTLFQRWTTEREAAK